MRQTHDDRRATREDQTRQWAAPLPDFSAMPRAPLQRLEWDTRDTANNRIWQHTQVTGAKTVTPEMLATHPTDGVLNMMPSTSRTDHRSWRSEPAYFPDSHGRPMLPKTSAANPYLHGVDTDGGGFARELQYAVNENNGGRMEDTSARIMGRTFEHQWISPAVTQQIAMTKIDAATALRPTSDDYNRSYRHF